MPAVNSSGAAAGASTGFADPGAEVAQRLDRRMRWALVIVPATILLLDLPTLLTSDAHYRPPWLESASYAGLVAITAVAACLVALRRPWGRWRWPLIAAALLASTAATAAMRPADLFGSAHWSWDIFGWWAVLFLVDRSLRALLAVIALHVLVSIGQLLASGGADRATAIGMAISAAALGGLPVAAWFVAASARRNAAVAAATAAARSRARVAEEVAVHIHADRQTRYAEVSDTAGPLLAALADGTADPGDPAVQRACFVAATRLRQLFAEGDASDDPLVHQLAVCADTASRRGLAVTVAVRGTRPPPPAPVRSAMTKVAAQALAAASSTARITVVSRAGEVMVTVVADLVGVAARPAGTGDGVSVTWEARGGTLWAEASWNEET